MIYFIKTNLSNYHNRGDKMENGIKKDDSQRRNSLENSLKENIDLFKHIFNGDETIKYREFENQNNPLIKCCVIYVDGMVKNEIISENIIEPIIYNTMLSVDRDILMAMKNHVIHSNDVEEIYDIKILSSRVIGGDTVLLVEGADKGLVISSKGWKARGIFESLSEKSISGPREAFTEDIMDNLAMIRRKIKTEDLKFEFKTIGERSNTRLCICYLNGVVNENALEELRRRLDYIKIDAVLDTGYIEELINEEHISPFRTVGSTERPDVVAAKILEGRIAVILDGTPVALTVPLLFIEYFQSSDDYYTGFYFASISRIVRFISFILTTSVPAIYISMVTFHQEMIPTPLLLSISSARQTVPFPTMVEALGLLFVFEILRETGIRIPSYIGRHLVL